MNAAASSPIVVSARAESDYRGLPRADKYRATFYTEDTSKGTATRLRREIRAWAKWFKSCGATELSFATKRAQYHQAGALTLGTFWAIKVTI